MFPKINMNVLIVFFFAAVACINASLSVYESLQPKKWLSFLIYFLGQKFFIKIYSFLLLFISILFTYALLATDIISRMVFLVWMINLYIYLSAFLFFFYSPFLKESLRSFVKEFPLSSQYKMVYLDCFMRLLASLIIGASLIP